MQLSVKDVADNANMIINGCAYTKDGDYIRVLNFIRFMWQSRYIFKGGISNEWWKSAN